MADNVALVQEAYDGFARGDAGPLVAILDENVEWHEAEHSTYWPGGPVRGPQAVLDGVIGPILRDFDGFRIDLVRLSSAGDTVLAEARYRGTARATGSSLDAQVAHVWDFADGKVVKWQQYTDTWQYAQVTGVEPRR
jgi:ketosteroid isomerase-like protein